jgi:hypothetical protein
MGRIYRCCPLSQARSTMHGPGNCACFCSSSPPAFRLFCHELSRQPAATYEIGKEESSRSEDLKLIKWQSWSSCQLIWLLLQQMPFDKDYEAEDIYLLHFSLELFWVPCRFMVRPAAGSAEMGNGPAERKVMKCIGQAEQKTRPVAPRQPTSGMRCKRPLSCSKGPGRHTKVAPLLAAPKNATAILVLLPLKRAYSHWIAGLP